MTNRLKNRVEQIQTAFQGRSLSGLLHLSDKQNGEKKAMPLVVIADQPKGGKQLPEALATVAEQSDVRLAVLEKGLNGTTREAAERLGAVVFAGGAGIRDVLLSAIDYAQEKLDIKDLFFVDTNVVLNPRLVNALTREMKKRAKRGQLKLQAWVQSGEKPGQVIGIHLDDHGETVVTANMVPENALFDGVGSLALAFDEANGLVYQATQAARLPETHPVYGGAYSDDPRENDHFYNPDKA